MSTLKMNSKTQDLIHSLLIISIYDIKNINTQVRLNVSNTGNIAQMIQTSRDLLWRTLDGTVGMRTMGHQTTRLFHQQ